MPILRIEHPVPDFDKWKQTFDRDPARRKESGVRRYTILRPVDDPRFVIVDLEFDRIEEAETFRAGLLKLWGRAEAEGLISGPKARILEIAESVTYQR
jgi:hypothetical protein